MASFDGKLVPPPPTYPRSRLQGAFVCILEDVREDRGLRLIPLRTRCIRRFDIHELILTDEAAARPATVVDRIAYLGFVEFTLGGVLAEGDHVLIDGEIVGHVAGFDETHLPNHMNIVVLGSERTSGTTRGLNLGAQISFVPQR